jgi:hypothetical protein
MKKLLFLSILILSRVIAFGGVLSERASISLLTASPGQELYSAFGHSAVWVHDPENGIDEVYNYGTFDFEAKNFYFNFVMGRLNYKLAVTNLNHFLAEYYYEGRGIEEQVIDLSSEEMNNVYEFLLWNRQPGNEYYLYDFFFDNCATRIRDFFDELLMVDWGNDLKPQDALTFRQLINPYLQPSPWARFGIYLALGLPADRAASGWEEMFLPDYMFHAFAKACHNDGRPLVRETRMLLLETNPPAKTDLISPELVCWLVFILGLLSFAAVRLARVFDKIFFTALGVVGLVIVFLWFVSDHNATNVNVNLLWAIPFHIYFIFKAYLLFPIGIPRHYFKIVFFLNVIVLVIWPIIPQTFHPAFIPIILLSAIKSFPYGFGDVWMKIPLFKKYVLNK